MEPMSTEPSESFKPYTLFETLTGHKSAISGVKFSSDGRLLGSSSADKTIRTYSLDFSDSDTSPTITAAQTFEGHDQGVSDLAFSADSRFMVSASDDKTLRLWDVATGELIKTLRGHTNYVFCANFNPQSNMIDPKDKQFKDFGNRGYVYYFMDSFVESLVLLDQTNVSSY